MSENKKDINWINVVRAISIISVFVVHCELYYGYGLGFINRYIHPYYVNAFFFVSGYLFFRKQLSVPVIEEKCGEYLTGGGRKLASNILFRLVLPSLIFAMFEFVPKKVIKGDALDIHNMLWETVGGTTYWFTSALVTAQIFLLLLLLTRCRNIFMYWSVSLLLTAYGLYMARHGMNFLGLSNDFWRFKHGLLCVSLVTAGGLYWKYEAVFGILRKKIVLIMMTIVYFTVFTLLHDKLPVLISMLDINFAGYVSGCLASILLIEWCRQVPETRVLSFIGRHSISFYFMSGALPTVMGIACRKQLGEPTWYGFTIVFLLSLTTAYIATLLINNYIPWLLDFRKLRNKSL